jgi:extradiol dioxygenase family protein
MQFDHVAIPTNDVAQSVKWYLSQFGGSVLYQDESWAFLNVGGQKIALVSPTQHPPHLALRVTETELDQAAKTHAIKIGTHRDGTRGIYLHDPFGNAVELIHYPPKQPAYEKK